MKSVIHKLIASFSLFALIVILGCSAFQDVLTPAWIPQSALVYADANGPSVLPWTTLFDARRVRAKMAFVHSWNRIKDDIRYEYESGISQFHITGAEQLQAAIFSPTGPIGMLIPASLAGTAGALLFSKPADKKKIKELEVKNNSKIS